MATRNGAKGQPLVAFLHDEQLYVRVEDGLRTAACQFSHSAEPFMRSGLVALSGWTVLPSRSVSRFGSVDRRTRTLRITSLDCSSAARTDTILHEVAHILTDHLLEGRECHGPGWRVMAKALGARPKASGQDDQFRRAAEQVRAGRLKTVARCRLCGFEVKRMRRSNRDWRRFVHRDCGGRFRASE